MSPVSLVWTSHFCYCFINEENELLKTYSLQISSIRVVTSPAFYLALAMSPQNFRWPPCPRHTQTLLPWSLWAASGKAFCSEEGRMILCWERENWSVSSRIEKEKTGNYILWLKKKCHWDVPLHHRWPPFLPRKLPIHICRGRQMVAVSLFASLVLFLHHSIKENRLVSHWPTLLQGMSKLCQ